MCLYVPYVREGAEGVRELVTSYPKPVGATRAPDTYMGDTWAVKYPFETMLRPKQVPTAFNWTLKCHQLRS